MPKSSTTTKNGVKPRKNIPERIRALREKREQWYDRAKATISAVKEPTEP